MVRHKESAKNGKDRNERKLHCINRTDWTGTHNDRPVPSSSGPTRGSSRTGFVPAVDPWWPRHATRGPSPVGDKLNCSGMTIVWSRLRFNVIKLDVIAGRRHGDLSRHVRLWSGRA